MKPQATLQQIRNWFDTPLGNQVITGEQAVLDQLLPGFFGYHFLQMSIQHQPLYDESPIQQKISMGLDLSDKLPFVGAANKLPFEDDSMDVVLLHHLLDFYESPLAMLREVARVSIPFGHVVIIGFNPMSLWGAYKPIGKMRGHTPFIGNFIRPGRLMDWLNVLDFTIDRAHYSTYSLPINNARFLPRVPDYSQGLSRKSNMPFGAIYVIVARKQVSRVTPIKPDWKPSRAFGQLTVVPPVGRGASRSTFKRTSPDSPE